MQSPSIGLGLGGCQNGGEVRTTRARARARICVCVCVCVHDLSHPPFSLSAPLPSYPVRTRYRGPRRMRGHSVRGGEWLYRLRTSSGSLFALSGPGLRPHPPAPPGPTAPRAANPAVCLSSHDQTAGPRIHQVPPLFHFPIFPCAIFIKFEVLYPGSSLFTSSIIFLLLPPSTPPPPPSHLSQKRLLTENNLSAQRLRRNTGR